MKYKHFIWDFDGTLADSYPHIIACFETILEEENIHIEHKMLEKWFYNNFAQARKLSGISDEGYKRFGHLHHLIGDEAPEPPITVIDGVIDILKRIIANGGDNYVYTNRNTTCNYWCKALGMDDYIKGYVTSEDGFKAKPCPDALLYLMEKYNLKPEECIMIGDREIDGLSGMNAGMDGCLISDFEIDENGCDPREISEMKYVCKYIDEMYDMFDITRE